MLTFQEMILNLTEFWKDQGCIVHQGYDVETGAGTFNPATFLRCLGPEPYKTVYVELSRRPSDGRFGENPNRLQLFHQLQVVIKPSPSDILELYKKSLESIGIDLKKHDLRFVHDDWESPTIGAYGLGWEVWIDGMEVSQITYFQAIASKPLHPISIEITYGLERLCMYVQNKDNFFEMQWNDTYTYGEIVKQNEVEWSQYNFSEASTEMWQKHFDDFEKEALILIEKNLPLVAYDFAMKASHAFNMLEARGVISVTERTRYITRIRNLSREIATQYLTMRENLAYPLLEKLPQEKFSPPKLKPLPSSFDPKHKDVFLLEIGSEALPASFVPIGMRNLELEIIQLLKNHSLDFDSIRVFGTPKRLGVVIFGLVEGSESASIKRKGPKVEVATGPDGLTKQGLGFLRAIGATSMDDPRINIENDYLCATIHKEGKSTYAILSEHLPHLILHLEFPKKMRWASLDLHYPRPIRWIVALYGSQVIPFSLGNVVTSNESFGHEQRDPKKIPLKNAHVYFDMLKEHKVIADPKEREKKILDQLTEINAIVLEKERVLSQVLYLTEWPILQKAYFDSTFLSIPKEVLISEMVNHQKYFPLANETGKLHNTFLITTDNLPNDLIQKGNEKVLSARLADGVFLYNQDLKYPLENFNEKLSKMLFQKELGSMLDKVDRLTSLAEKVHELLPIADAEKVKRAAHLCKADLASSMVAEFPELQGTIGKYYALFHKEDEEVATAIEEHWMPRGEADDLPKTQVGIILSLADKIDNLNSYFKIGLKPTSSSDPYSLRRQTIGIIKILIEHALSLDLSCLLSEEVLHFVTARAKHVFEDYGFAPDEIEASFSDHCTDPFDQYCQLKALHAFRKTDQFEKLFEVYKRAKGQLEKGTAGTFDPDLVKEPAEKKLISSLSLLEKPLHALLNQKNYLGAFEEISKLQKPLADLFDTVKILADDPNVQKNRLSLLQKVFSHFEKLLDFSKIHIASHESH